MNKLSMQTTNIVDENIKRIGELFPNCMTERLNDEGRPEIAIDFDQLRQVLSKDIVEGNEERYQFTWPDKRNAIRLANVPTTDTLRPVRDDETKPTGADSEGKPYCSTGSVNFDTTQNLYIEGDNLQVLKLLREDYLGKIKMIYIDPPYNTGNDFVYDDDFNQDTDFYKQNSGQTDTGGNRLRVLS
jgi:adenine-specific DNA-methyltransferase